MENLNHLEMRRRLRGRLETEWEEGGSFSIQDPLQYPFHTVFFPVNRGMRFTRPRSKLIRLFNLDQYYERSSHWQTLRQNIPLEEVLTFLFQLYEKYYIEAREYVEAVRTEKSEWRFETGEQWELVVMYDEIKEAWDLFRSEEFLFSTGDVEEIVRYVRRQFN